MKIDIYCPVCAAAGINHGKGRLLMQVDTPVGNTLPDMAATMALTYVCHKVSSKDTGTVNVMKM